MPFTRVVIYSVSAAAFGGTLFYLRPRSQPPVIVAPAPVASTLTPRPRIDGRIRIGLASLNGEGQREIKLPSGGAVWSAAGKRLRSFPPGTKLAAVADYTSGKVVLKGRRTWAEAPELTLQAPVVQIGRRRYPGEIALRLAGTGLELVNELDIEQYLEGVLPGELPPGFDLEAQKALAVAARSYALVQAGKHGDFDLCDRTCCQMYLGMVRGARRGLAAVRATRRECLWSEEDLVYAFYSADCGGKSTFVAEVPLRDKPEESLPYLRPVKDAPASGPDYCAASPYHQWSRRYTREELEAKLNRRPETAIGKLQGIRIEEWDASGRVRSVKLTGEALMIPGRAFRKPDGTLAAGEPMEKIVSGWELRRSVGELALKSTRMSVDQPVPEVFRFQGSGFGHGLGLCQIGANGMARQGHDYRQILAHYYPGTRVRTLSVELGSTPSAQQ